MKKISIMIVVFILVCTGTAFAGHGQGHGNYGGHGGGHGSYHYEGSGGHHGSHHTSWSIGIYPAPVAVAAPVYPAYYYPPAPCRYIDVYDAWGNYRGTERVCY